MAEETTAKSPKSTKPAKAKGSFFKKLKAEFNKIIWTDKKTLGKQTAAVIVISAIICVLISIVDGVALQLMQLIMQ